MMKKIIYSVIFLILSAAVFAEYSLETPMPFVFDESERDVTVSKDFTIINDGDKKLEGLKISSNTNSIYNLNISPSWFDLDLGESKIVSIRSYIPLYTDSGISSIGLLKFEAANYSKSVSINSNAKNKIEITNIVAYIDDKKRTISSDDTEVDAEPGSDFEVEVEIENLFTDIEIDDVFFTVNITDIVYDIDEDEYKNLGEKSDNFYIKKSKSKKQKAKLSIPSVVGIGLHTVDIFVEAEDNNGAEHKIRSKFLLNIEKEKYQTKITDLDLSPDTIDCSSYADLKIKITNIGEKDDDVVLTVKNKDLGIDISKEVFLASEIHSEINEYKQRIEIFGEDIMPGVYPIDIVVERDDYKIEDSKTISLAVKGCEEEKEEEIVSDTELKAMQNLEILNQHVYSEKEEKSSAYDLVISIVIILWIGFIVFVIGAFIIYNKR